MARYQKTFTMVDTMDNSLAQIRQIMGKAKYKYEPQNGEHVFRKGDGVWVVARYVKLVYRGNTVFLEAWLNNTGIEMNLDGVYGFAVKKPLRKLVDQVEQVLTKPGAAYVPCQQNLEETPVFVPVQSEQVPAGISKKEFFKNYAGDSFNRGIKGLSILAYVFIGLNTVISLLLAPIGLLDSAILLGLTLGMHLGKSKGCAIGILVYSIISVVLSLIGGSFSGWMWVVIGVSSLLVFRNAEKRYQELANDTVELVEE